MGNTQDQPAVTTTNTPTVEPSPAVTTPSTQGPRHHRSRHHGSTRQTRPRFVQIGNIALSVIKGNIIHQTTDVLVNSAAPDLDLRKGRASKSLLEAAGDSIQSECTDQYPTGINSKTVAITGPGNLHCKAIFHVTLPKWQAQGDEKNIDVVVRNCLAEANKQRLTSMSFPALGTGFLKYPPRTVIASMFKTVEDFAKSNPNSTVKIVNCIVFAGDNDTFKEFLDEAKSKATSKGLQEKDMVTRNSLNANIGTISVDIAVGSIITERADVIVNSCPSDMKLDSRPGLAKAMYEAAGSGLQAEIDQNYPNGLKIGDLAVTDGHSLHCKKLYHGCMTSFYAKKASGLLPEKVLQNFVTKCLVEAKKNSVQSIVFPALGTGFLKFPPKTAATNVIKAIREFQMNNLPSTIKTIKIVIFGGTNDWSSVEQAYTSEVTTTGKGAAVSIAQTAPLPTPKRGTRAYLAHKYREEPRTPSYWTHFLNTKTIKEWNTTQKGNPYKVSSVDQKTYKSISRAFNNTGGSTIVRIERIENILLFEQYTQECQRTFRKAYVTQACTPLKDVQQSTGIAVTMKHLDKEMTNHLHDEINECYLFHGTKVAVVDVITQQGLDSRLASSGLLGTGVYAADTAAKSTGYTDQNQSGERKMFLMRVCLGDIFITKTCNKYKRPPCKTCGNDFCTTHPELYDSVVAEFNMRELVVYDSSKCYPEYLITYK
ncbi:protein mono-ADP-ribosyltransferase PARP15-like [Mytilus galloprovincialis]|uniref:protein mono-ADP-ribosyltransferase PARP15-like n=1 Tax=Mytilus galloprovincialis TaxID=29158 RepID=UPI003F7B4634